MDDGKINELTQDVLGKWPSFEAQSWACKVVHVVLNKLRPQTPEDVAHHADLLSFFVRFGSAASQVLKQTVEGDWVDKDGQSIIMNQQMQILAVVMEDAVAFLERKNG